MREVGEVIDTVTYVVELTSGERQLYWFIQPGRFSRKQARRLAGYFHRRHSQGPGVDLHGPFKTDAEVKENQRLVLFGPQCKVTDAGMWNPAWDKLQ